MEEKANKDEDLDFLLKAIKARHLSKTKITNSVIITSMFVLALFLLYSGITASSERSKLEAVIDKLTEKNVQLNDHLNQTKLDYDRRFSKASIELRSVQERLADSTEKLNEQISTENYEYRNRIEAIEIYTKGVIDLRKELNSIYDRLDTIENRAKEQFH
ncbi:hypothetical protein VT06_15100 [Arsukibacterium sp. MJ3]|uniref:hypothetical protein n=1 Tax=Arsukibacterium sp. MJ3 TaxID=1632859 RepID=UPI000627205A|nr:hypothetical protein [Arsukibacterium sp. MJ3]KKO47767.1 hypothetical protein VT06_15100 [Arsukibacterium sp. MJ3]